MIVSPSRTKRNYILQDIKESVSFQGKVIMVSVHYEQLKFLGVGVLLRSKSHTRWHHLTITPTFTLFCKNWGIGTWHKWWHPCLLLLPWQSFLPDQRFSYFCLYLFSVANKLHTQSLHHFWQYKEISLKAKLYHKVRLNKRCLWISGYLFWQIPWTD